MAAKIRRLARNSKLGDDGAVTSLGNSPPRPHGSSANQRKENRNELRPEVQADSTGEWRGAAVSFATKQEAIAYIVSLAPRRTSLLDIREAGSGADAQGIEAVSPLTDAGVAALGPDAPKDAK